MNATSLIEADSREGWYFVLVSSLACITGASIVFVDKLWKSSQGSILENPKFLAASLSLASGVLLFSSLYTLLPAAQKRLHSDFLTYTCFFAGAAVTLLITYIVRWFTPDAIDACGAHGADFNHDNAHGKWVHNHTGDEEQHPLYHDQHIPGHHSEYGSVNDRACREPASDEHQHGHVNLTQHDHDSYLSIGIQTAIAICIHKFPEGLVMFISSRASRQLGLSVTVAMSIHNLIEGAMIALPLYYATKSRVIAFGYSSFLGGLSQPLGAILGLLALHNVSERDENRLFGFIFGLTSGMMTLIAVQSMLPQAVRAHSSLHLVPLFFFIGIFTIGFATLVKS
ncbi:Zinc/iron permease [Radiomyces spectabilis]|uniref:Zinc/iron permease n=1 Tax=Radiomyces spectabilis TaxID=64574 RepID=UPI00221FA0E4|nr:Zinc/iron permease [Radiomyces spectabilis]KAI8393516.1 Zinc/iron permease [Radiomyces spectabilis]